MFNIGGQGQYIVGAVLAIWIGSSFEGLNPLVHVLFAAIVGALCGAIWAGIAGFLKATVGAHEVISTIMLNWIATRPGSPVRAGRPLRASGVAVSNDCRGAQPLIWGSLLQGLHAASSSRSRRSSFWASSAGRPSATECAVGFNRSGPLYSSARNCFLAMAIAGVRRAAGAIDIRWRFDPGYLVLDIGTSIAVALGRNTAATLAALSSPL
jgi:simple sugar transport system permease protein